MYKLIGQKAVLMLLLAVFVGGYSSLSLELIVLRQLSSFVGSTTITVSIVMGSFLAFMSWGYYKGSVESVSRFSLRNQAANDFLIIAMLVVLASSYILIDVYFMAFNEVGITSNIIQTALYSLLFLSYGPYLFGKITAMLSRYLHYRDSNFTGKIMAVDTVGSVLGSLFTTLIIMPFIGVNHTIVVVVLITLAASFFLSRRRNYVAMLTILLAAVLFNQDKLLKDTYGIIENNAVATIGVHKTDGGKSRLLVVNGSMSSKVSKEHKLNFPYINFINDNFIRTIPKTETKDILVVGAGGFTVGIDDTRNNYVYVDVDKNLKRITEEAFLKQKLTPNKKFVVQDANQFLKESRDKYDVIVLDTYSSRQYIPMELVTREYFERAKNNLKEGGVLLLNAIASPNFGDDFAMNLDNTLRSVFRDNLRAQTIRHFNAWKKGTRDNIVYIYYNHPNPGKIYTINKNPSFYDYQL